MISVVMMPDDSEPKPGEGKLAGISRQNSTVPSDFVLHVEADGKSFMVPLTTTQQQILHQRLAQAVDVRVAVLPPAAFASPPPPEDVEAWRALRGADLTAALTAARWYPMADDLIGGWCVMPAPYPPSSGLPEVGSFMSEALARHVADLHNAGL